MEEPSFAPVYSAMYPEWAEIARLHGYALAVHGSVASDFDLICVPWAELPSDPITVLNAFAAHFRLKIIGDRPVKKNHGREAWVISIGWGHCRIDCWFLPRMPREVE